MKNRILEFLKVENKSSAEFADEIGVQPSSISHIVSGRNNPSLDFILRMLTKYPSLSTDWLLFGKGKMYREPQLHDLFDDGTTVDHNALTEHPENKQDNDFHLPGTPSVTESSGISERKNESGANKAKRIVFFFDDRTFIEYFSG